MSWTWRAETADGVAVSTGSAAGIPSQPTQSDAETWLGESWHDLAADGVARVSLYCDGALVYGPMSLTP